MNVTDLLAPDGFTDRSRRRALNAWRTGDLVQGAHLFWAGPAGADPVLGLPGDSTDARWKVRSAGGQDSGWAIVTSQTCDVAGAGPGERAPTVQVSPVWPAGPTKKGWLREVELRLHTDFYLVDAHPDGDPWIADLRISLPLSKAALLAPTPRHAFSDDKRTLGFLEHLTAKQGRPALHDDLSELLVPSLRQLLEPAEAAWKYGIEQVRLLVLEGTRLQPVRVQLLVVLEDDKTTRKPMDTWRGKTAKTLARRPAGVRLTPTRWAHLPKLPAGTYRDAVPLRLPELDRGEFR